MLIRRALSWLSVALLCAVAACTDHTKIRPHTALGPFAEPLRTQFNRDVGHVRVLMIIAPT